MRKRWYETVERLLGFRLELDILYKFKPLNAF
jgi:hypothetical protein